MDNDERKRFLRALPSVDELLRAPELKEASALHSAPFVAEAARAVLDGCRAGILGESGAAPPASNGELVGRALAWMAGVLAPGTVRVVNATGTILHTNIGRAILPKEAIEAVVLAAGGNTNLEFDLEGGSRGNRDARVEGLLMMLTGAEAACVVNNNAAAVLIALNTLAESREVVVSRGELIEIGGSFRLPEIIEKSGCVLKEVGTTNRTHESDYEGAVGERTALLFKAHTSNFKVVGFTASVELKRLAAIGRARSIPVVEDLGSGSIVDIEGGIEGSGGEPTVGRSLSAGASVVTFSGDKLLGGPQAGLICGRKELVDRIRKNPLKRALRADKMTLAALEATLRLYLNRDTVMERIPTLRLLTRPLAEVERTARKAEGFLKEALGPGFTVRVEDSQAVAGGGSMPGRLIPSKAVSVTHARMGPEKIFRLFLCATPAILGRVSGERFLLDMRAIEDAADVVPSGVDAG